MDWNNKVINILGTDYTILVQDIDDNPKLQDANGLCEIYAREIVLDSIKPNERNYKNIEEFKKKVLRHELVHAFFAESGLRSCSDYAENEELVDWIATQLPKMVKACNELEIL